MPTPYSPGAGRSIPSSAHLSRKKSCGSCISAPAPSPVSGSQPQAPRWARFSSTSSPFSSTSWDLRPLTLATRPTPQASRSNLGS